MSNIDDVNREKLEQIVCATEGFIAQCLKDKGYTDFFILHYGANWIDPKYLVIWICVKTDTERVILNDDVELIAEAKKELVKNGYPAHVMNEIHIGAESQETVDRESGGNWWHHFK